jgi:hypothetical protein
MTTQIIDSDLRCRYCSKRMMLELGQQDEDGRDLGTLVMIHTCWSCGWTVRDDRLRRPLPTRTPQFAERLKRQRLEGTVIPIQYDTTPFPKGEFDDDVVRPDAERLDAR